MNQRPKFQRFHSTVAAFLDSAGDRTFKQRNVLPLRAFVRRTAGSGLLDVLPVWLVSPETMAVLFPRDPLFDRVVFDEASQVTVESGIPVLLRTRRAVIAGDDKQMPPSEFFSTKGELGDAPLDTADGPAKDLLDDESLLVLARRRCAHEGLAWHYRCREEELIAFSNHSMYRGDLLTIPSTATRNAPPALRWVDVPDGQYESGRNPNEARRVVDVLDEILQREPRCTVGAVTFNIVQRKTVLDEIDTRRARDAAFAARWDAAMAAERLDERPFVKNLENVQGDERDVIVFSLGHAPVDRARPDGRVERVVPSRFGPLGQARGERRLNVAISRARRECVVVASFEPDMLSVARTTHDGPRLFKAWLEFVRHLSRGQRNQADRVLDRVREQARGTARAPAKALPGYIPLPAQVAARLEERGVRCELDVGTSRFRVPVGVVDPKDPHRYVVAVLCDDGTDTAPVLDTHLQRPEALRTRGWKVVRISARDWWRNPLREVERVLRAAQG